MGSQCQPALAPGQRRLARHEPLPHFILRPHGIVLTSVALSALAWSFPDLGIRMGFAIKEPVTIDGISFLLGWYGLITAFSLAGFRAGRSIRMSRQTAGNLALSRKTPYVVISAVAWTGVVSAYLHIIQVIGWSGIRTAIARDTVNDLRDALYTDYVIGPYSLRYVVAIAAGLALFRFLEGFRPSLLDTTNLLMLVAAAAISSRLSVVWAVMTGLSTWAAARSKEMRYSRWRLALLAGIVIALLWGLNHSRNANYYERHGTSSLVMSGLGEIRAYLGAPFQVSLGMANHMDLALAGVASKYYVDREGNLVTNSALDQSLPQMGYFALFYISATTFCYSLIAGLLIQLRRTYLFLGYPVILYAFAELWRVDLFRQGIFCTNMLAALGIPLLLRLFLPGRMLRTMTGTPIA
jgi:hypothetical protein